MASATRDVGARPDGEMHVGRARQRRRSRIDDDELRAALLRLAHVRDEMNAGRRRVDAPEHDQRGLRVVLIGDRRHLAVERLVGRAGRRRADRARQPRRAEAPPQRARRGCPASAGRSSRRTRTAGSTRRQCRARAPRKRSATQLERLVPRDALEPALALRVPCGPPDRAADPDRRRARRTADLRADVAVGDRVLLRSVERRPPCRAGR